MFRRLFATALALALSSLAHAQPLTTAFTFQGQLNTAGATATGLYDARFRLYDAATGGTQIGSTLCSNNLSLVGGVFTTQLDFGPQFAGQQRFLEVEVRQDTGLDCSNPAGFVILGPRQPLTAAPNAVYSLSAASAATATTATTATSAVNASQLNGQPASFYQNAANLTGSLPSAALSGTYSSQLNLSNAANTFAGSGAGLTNIPWTGITGAPATILLQPTVPGPAQSGGLNIDGVGLFGDLKSGVGLTIGGPGVAGDLLNFVNAGSLGCGFVLEGTSNETLALNVNLDSSTVTASAGAAVRVCATNANRAIQFSTRAAGSTTVNDAINVATSGNVGFGTNPFSTFRIASIAPPSNSSTLGIGGWFEADIDGTVGLLAISGSSGAGFGLQAYAEGTSSTALYADQQSQSGTNFALHAIAESPGGYAGFFEGIGTDALVVANNGPGRGIHITSNSDTGVWSVTNTGFAGVDGRTSLAAGGVGVIGQALATSGVNYGVQGRTNSSTGFGVFSNGNTGASGTKSFRIDHPADPTHKYLMHYCTESPEVLNAYRGTITLNQQGEATIDLPSYFARINTNPSYQLTPVGAAMPLLHVSQEISADALAQGEKAAPADLVPTCSFTISGGAPNAKVCWRIEAQRNDRWVQTHGAPVEVNKEGPEDGAYQHPDLYNQ